MVYAYNMLFLAQKEHIYIPFDLCLLIGMFIGIIVEFLEIFQFCILALSAIIVILNIINILTERNNL